MCIVEGKLPEELMDYYRPSYLLALHKDEDDPTQLRPIGIAVALRRVASAHIAKCSSPHLAAFLCPMQYGIGIKGGVELLSTAMTIECEKFLAREKSRLMLSLDLKNFFNSCSRRATLHVLKRNFPALAPYFERTYGDANKSYYELPDGGYGVILMHEGYPQGDPLSPITAASY